MAYAIVVELLDTDDTGELVAYTHDDDASAEAVLSAARRWADRQQAPGQGASVQRGTISARPDPAGYALRRLGARPGRAWASGAPVCGRRRVLGAPQRLLWPAGGAGS